MPEQKVIGAIDVGSNAIRMICARLTEDYRIEELEKNRTPIRLGEDVFLMGYITEERIEKLLETIKVYQKTLEQNNCSEICAYSTSAFRESGNRQAVMERVKMETGIQLEAISGGEEAQLLQRAVQHVMDLTKGRIMLADLGGGSIEVTMLEDGEIQFAESFRMGTVRMLKMFPYHPDKEKAFLKWTEYYVDDFIDFLNQRLGQTELEQLVITGGNATALGRFSGKIDSDSKGFKEGRMFLSKQNFSKFKRNIFKHNLRERIKDLKMDEDRADVILPALVIFEKLLKFSGCSGFYIPAVGLRDGILDEMRERQGVIPDRDTREQVIHSARCYSEKYHANIQHAETVRELSLQLFDELVDLHELQSRERLLLEAAALLHDIGRFIRPSDHAKHSMYLIRNMELVGVTNSELMMISLVARYHSGGNPSVKQKEFSRLDSGKRTLVTRLTALLRIADALDREHRTRAGNLKIEHDQEQVWLNLECITGKSTDSILALWALSHKKELFEKVFRRTLNVDFSEG